MSDLFNSGIRPVIDDYLLQKSKEKRDYGEFWSASSAGYCMRRNIFERLGVPHVESDSDARKQRVFESGHIFHSWIQGLTKDAGISIAQELELEDSSLMIRGHIDDLILIKGKEPEGDFSAVGEYDFHHSPDIEPDRLILYDYKTQNSRAFSYKRDAMSHYHKYQLATYMYMLRKDWMHGTVGDGLFEVKDMLPNLSEARILKLSKDDLRMSEEQLLWSPELEKEVYEYWSTLNGYWKSKKIPKCTCADYEKNSKTGIGFMADPRYNGYFKYGEPCSLRYYEEWRDATANQSLSV